MRSTAATPASSARRRAGTPNTSHRHPPEPARAVVITLLLVALLASGCGGGGDGGSGGAGAKGAKGARAKPKPKPPPELPRGGRVLLPKYRIVTFYGAPQADELGVLGIGTPTRAGKQLLAYTKAYRRFNRPTMPAMELIVTIAANAPGPDGLYRNRTDDKIIRRYLKAARKIKAILILDVQPGRAEFLPEVMRLRKYLVEPDVSLAIDPEWRVRAPALPGQQIGFSDAREVNAVSFWLDRLTREKNLPQKLLLVHRFTNDMIHHERRLKRRRSVAMVLNVDGFGTQTLKIDKYKAFTRADRRFFNGFKLFFNEDTNTMKPREVNRLRPKPDLVMYE